MRCIEKATLDLRGMTVLIGENGAGKSTLIEAVELLRLLSVDFESGFYTAHRGTSLLRHGSRSLSLGVTLQVEQGEIEYDITLGQTAGGGFSIVRETLLLNTGAPTPLRIIDRRPDGSGTIFSQRTSKLEPLESMSPTRPAISSFGRFPPNAAIENLRNALESIEVHVPFGVSARWARGDASPLRQDNVVRPTTRLDRFGSNLANVWHALKNRSDAEWQQALFEVRVGLGEDIDTIQVPSSPSGGQVNVAVLFRDGRVVTAHDMSDGMLAFLAFVGLYRLTMTATAPVSLLAFDEPELHLHPELLVRVVSFFEEIAESRPVVITTHSDRFLDALSDPAASTLICDAGPGRRDMNLLRLDPEALGSWLKEYRGVGSIRAAGHTRSVVAS
jgi:predicted ATPase